MKKAFNYIRNIWEGEDKKPSLRAIGAMVLVFNFVENINWAIHKWEVGRSFEGLSLVLGIEAGLITALLGITAWSNISAKKIEADVITPVAPIITVQKADTVTSTTATTKAETVNTKSIDTVNSQTTNITKEPTDAK